MSKWIIEQTKNYPVCNYYERCPQLFHRKPLKAYFFEQVTDLIRKAISIDPNVLNISLALNLIKSTQRDHITHSARAFQKYYIWGHIDNRAARGPVCIII